MKLLALLCLVVLRAAVNAGVLVDNGQLDPSAPAPISNFSHADGNQLQAADRFTLVTNASIRRIEFWGLYCATNGPSGPLRDDFTSRIFADTNGAPAQKPVAEYHVGRVSRRRAITYVNPVFGPYDFYAYSAVLPHPVKLPAGQYWLSVVNDISVVETGVTCSAGA